MNFILHKGIKDLKNNSHKKSKVKKIPREIKMYAMFADLAYKATSTERNQELRRFLKRKADDWKILRQFSTDRIVVVVNKKQRILVMSNRGTKTLSDLFTDVFVATGTEELSHAFKKARRAFKRIARYASKKNLKVVLAGHSLGATINLHLWMHFREQIDKVYNYNPGSSVSAIRSGVDSMIRGHDNSAVHNYFIEADPISTMGRGDTTMTNVVYPAQGVNPHSLANFLH